MDKQVNKLARQLRDEGMAPERDLLPGIWESIDDPESNAAAPSWAKTEPANQRRGLFNTSARWRMAAVAATLVLLLGSGYFQTIFRGPSNDGNLAMNDIPAMTDDSTGMDSPQASTNKSLLRSLNQAISDLASAQALDPDNLKLTRLSLLTHKSRANLLRVGSRR